MTCAKAKYFLVVLLLCFTQAATALEGFKPYTPSRLEWFAVEMNAGGRVELSEASGYLLDFVPIEKEDAILIYVRYLPTVNREVMNMAIESAREIIAMNAKSRHWNSWLRVKEDIKMAEPTK